MKTGITILALIIALFGFNAANAQGRGNGNVKGNKGRKEWKKMNKHDRDDDYYRNKNGIYRDRDYDDNDDQAYNRNRRRSVYYPNDRVYYLNRQRVYYPGQNVRNLPPGQAKKIYGHQSAKAFAPGQRKKQYNNSIYFPQRRVVYDRRYGNDYYRERQQGELARRIGSIFGF